MHQCMHAYPPDSHVSSTPFAEKCTNVCCCMPPLTCPSHPSSGPFPMLECVSTSIHMCLSTNLFISAPPPLYSYVQICVPLCVPKCFPVSPLFSSQIIPLIWRCNLQLKMGTFNWEVGSPTGGGPLIGDETSQLDVATSNQR